MNHILKFSVLVLMSCFMGVHAQKITKVDAIAGNQVFYTMDAKIDNLINKMEEKCNVKNGSSLADANASTDQSFYDGSTVSKPTTPSRELTTAEICRKNPRISGYKIQLAVVKSYKEANDIKAEFRQKFPYIKAETDASLRPNYKILVGSYYTKESAGKEFKNIKREFPTANIVRYFIFCAEGK